MKRTFVYVACGDKHVEATNLSLGFLKTYSKNDIVVIRSRSVVPIEHDQVIDVVMHEKFNDHQASILIKTGLPLYLGNIDHEYCYIDNDVVAVSDRVDTIFDHRQGVVTFARDHNRLDTFSRYAVQCGCASGECDHLQMAIQQTFGVTITDPKWQHWNGGVFLFNPDSIEFLKLWRAYTERIFKEPYWSTRDQGTLVAVIWKLQQQFQGTLPGEFNYIVDRLRRMSLNARATARVQDYPVDTSYALRPGATASHPVMLHFINGGIGCRGWKNWDDAVALLNDRKQSLLEPSDKQQDDVLTETAAVREVVLVKETVVKGASEEEERTVVRQITEDNRIVHGMWIGKELSRLELLTLHSFLEHGHEFHLWAYDDIETPLPAGVVLEDASEILPRERIFKHRSRDVESGVGKGSYGTFSDLFRYKLLYDKGGYWVDMDITCLKPLDFASEYVFRSHRVGVVGNFMKCPKGSPLMRETYEMTAKEANEDSPWLMTNRLLSENVIRFGLSDFIRGGICNQDLWHVLKPFIEADVAIPESWYVIHWINEFWRTIKENNGVYRGKKIFDTTPDKDRVYDGTTMARLYRKYGLFDPTIAPEKPVVKPADVAEAPKAAPQKEPKRPEQPLLPPLVAPLNTPAARQPILPQIAPNCHINILITSMALGGAERIVRELLAGLASQNPTSKLFVLNNANPSYPVQDSGRMRVFSLATLKDPYRMRTVALEVLASPMPVIYTHMVPVAYLRQLWDYGVRTIPVIHNSQNSWQDGADAFEHPQVPFVVTVSDAVAEQMRAEGCRKPIITLRHELQRWFSPEELQANRTRIRLQYGIRNDTILIGMVGQFKLQKGYTRAARVLQRVKESHPAKLMILGGWDHSYGGGREAYTAFCRQALELGVLPDVITPGAVNPTEPYYAAFDIFLNTSMYEGLSISMLEAIQCGCPVVTADAGGNREALSANSVLVEDASNIDAYVDAMWPLLDQKQRNIPAKQSFSDLVPRLWAMISRYGVPEPHEASQDRSGTLFVTDNINIGGPQRSLTNLLQHLAPQHRSAVCVLEDVYSAEYLESLENTGVPVFSLQHVAGSLSRTDHLLHMVESMNIRNICFWNAHPMVKLLLAKVLHERAIRLIDVSPGPMLFHEMDRVLSYQKRICLSEAQYYQRLDRFVAKYNGGGVPPCVTDIREKTVVIPNGVPDPELLGAAQEITLPEGVDPEFVIGTCSRIVPSKRVHFLVDMMTVLTPKMPKVSLIVVGGVDPRHVSYWNELSAKIRATGLTNIHFVGAKADVRSYLKKFKVFVMISDNQGCPNASLEAMMMGLPVVANASGGTAEQVKHGVNGFLISDTHPEDMARRVAFLLDNEKTRATFGAAGRKIAETKFSMEVMAERYRALFESC